MKISSLINSLVMAVLVSMTACSTHKQANLLANDERVPENRVIYEVFPRNFSEEGTLKGVEKQIPRLKDLGVDVVWLMPIYELGDTGKWGPYSSPYAIKNYTKINPDLGTEQDLRDLVKTIHDNGMEIWFDWVGNHTAMDNEWVTSHPEYYTHTPEGDFIHPFNGAWKDVYELDKDNEAMQQAMVDAMQYWVDNFDIDGYRCDYASGPSPDLWQKTSGQVLKNGKRIAWLAEDASRPSLIEKGYFDYNYCWDFQEKVLKHFAKDSDLAKLKEATIMLATTGLTEGESRDSIPEGSSPYAGRSRMVYLVNHDVVQDQGGSEDIVYGKYVKPLTVLQFTAYGMPLLYNGQEIQYQTGGRVSLAEKTPIDWTKADTTMTALIKKLIEVKHTQPALRTGTQAGKFIELPTSADDAVFAYRRTNGENDVIVMLNFSETPQKFTVSGNMPEGNFEDVLSGRSVNFQPATEYELPSLGSAVYVRK